ncbi:MAG: helix-turn-helix domain-containing protein [Candidatus Heimdallarchaeota archaeon]|nr:helix-turn-helix domain-containing protein [Candidatus Heimdallarchaeota archaeon]
MKKKLLTEIESMSFIKEIVMFKNPEKMKAILNTTRWSILEELSKEPKFPADLAREMNLNEQKIYYHIRQLLRADLIEVAYEKEIRGAKAKYYKTKETTFGIDLNPTEKGMRFVTRSNNNEKLQLFFHEFYKDGKFDGIIVVGDPDPHGPHKTWARDGHYAIYLTMFLGQFLPYSEKMLVKLDVEVRAEKIFDQNMILIGGPAVNLVTHDINSKLSQPVFDKQIKGIAPEANFGRGITSMNPDIFYSQNTMGIIFKEPNPYNHEKTIIAFAGQGRRGTKAAILALTNNWKILLKDYQKGAFRTVVEGYDLDGDGTIDSIEILE